MKSRGLTIALVVLAVLVGLLYWSNRHPPADSLTVSTTPSEPAPKILTLNEADVSKIELKRKAGDQIVLARDNGGKWQITAPKTIGVDDTSVSGMVASLSTLSSERLVEDKAASLDRYGLTNPALEVMITEKNNAVHKLLIGDDTPTGKGAYAKLDGDPRVFTIASYTKTGIDKGVDDLRDKRLITADADKVSRLELIVKQQDIEFGRDKDQWQILKPKPLRADGTKVDDLVRKVTDAKLEAGAGTDASKAASTFAAGTAVATAKVTTDAGIQQLEVRKSGEDYYAKSSVTDGVYKVASDLGQAMDKKLDDFRNKKLFDFGLTDPDKIEIHDGGKTYLLTRSGEDWTAADGKKFDKAGVLDLLSNLRNLEANDFSESGFTTSVMEITVTSNGGKRVEKVQLSKGNKSVARREGEATLYVLDSTALDTLEKLVGALKT